MVEKKIILSKRDRDWIQALLDAANELNMQVDWERMRLEPLNIPAYPYELGDQMADHSDDQEYEPEEE